MDNGINGTLALDEWESPRVPSNITIHPLRASVQTVYYRVTMQ